MTLRSCCLILGIAVVLSGSGRVAGQEWVYRDSSGAWSVTVPEGWGEAEPQVLAQLERSRAQFGGGGRFTYTVILTPARRDVLTFPYMLGQATSAPMSEKVWREVRREAAGGAAMERGIESITSSVDQLLTAAHEGTIFDAERNRLVSRISMEMQGQKVRGLSYTHPARDGLIHLHFYTATADFEDLAPQFAAIADSFSVAPGHALGDGGRAAGRSSVLTGAIRGAIIGAVVAVVVSVFMRKKGNGKATGA